MIRRTVRARFVALGVTAALALGIPAAGALAAPKERDRPAEHVQRRAKVVRFAVVGTVKAVDATARTLVVAAKAPRKVRGTDVTVVVAETARIRRDGHALLEDVQVGDRAAVRGIKDGEQLLALRVNASVPEPEDVASPEASPSPSPSPSPEPSPTS